MRGEAAWQLYIDESGDFDAGSEARPLVVAGLLIEGASRRSDREQLRQLIGKLYPMVRYPPHARDLNHIGGLLAELTLSETRIPEWKRLHDTAIRPLRDAPAAAGYLAALERGWIPRYDEARTAGSWLRAHAPRAAAGLQQGVEDLRRRSSDFLRQLPPTLGASRACAVAAVAHDRRPLSGVTDRYVALLTALFERVFALLRARGKLARVWADVAMRDVVLDGLPPLPLMPASVGHAVSTAARFPWLPSDGLGDGVRIVPNLPRRFDVRVHPGIVAADLIANRIRHFTRSQEPGWRRLQRLLEAALGIPVVMTAACAPALSPRPSIAADGEARDAIEAGFTGCVPALERVPRGWCRDQAAQWIEAARVARGAHG